MTKVKLSELFYVDDSGIHGKGLFAKKALKKGRYLGTYNGPETTDLETGGPHVLWAEQDDGTWLGRDGRNILRYLNHHHRPTCEFDGFDLYALRNIPADSELTIHYGEEFVEAIKNEEV
ncbi:MAG: SET domain-containing protein [Gammaproteobacteria bacterium]|nr:SET domain-containing protein [Gammaproteobacteria bacterium]MCW8993403.1 SET domain-containing protein [Gammaproteobacteria bacterium]